MFHFAILIEFKNSLTGQTAIDAVQQYIKDRSITEDLFKFKRCIVHLAVGNEEIYTYEPIENIHKDQILKYSKIPADITDEIFKKAQANAKLIAEKLDYIGTMCVEYFIDQNNTLLVNEIAPRVHNSGHLTINAFNISQFENHVRAVCGLSNEKVEKISNAEMINILGKEINEYRSKSFRDNEFFFDYGKRVIKDKRKMGHLTILK